MLIKKLISSLRRSQRKKRVISEILSRDQVHTSTVNIHRIDRRNIGDYFSAPHHYFPELENTALDIFDYKHEDQERTSQFIEKISNSSLIVGGGGLLNRGGFRRQMKLFEDLASGGKKVVFWGVGHNDKSPRNFGKVKNYNIDISKFELAGTRDYSFSNKWVPCVSCMHPLFDKEYKEDREIGLVFHKDTLRKPAILKKFEDFPSTSNTTDLKSLLEFIGSSETVITDSYHAMYWSILLNKKVVTIPNSSKFFDFKYDPVFSSFDSCIADVKKAKKYQGVLEECREINRAFAEKVFNSLNI